MVREKQLSAKITGFSRLNTKSRPPNLDDTELTNLENMVYTSDGSIEIRNGSALFKSNAQWGENAVIEGKGYELNESGAEIMSVIDNGEVYYIKVANYSSDPRTEFNPGEDWIEVAGVGGNPFLTVTDTNKVFCEVINNRVFFTDGTNQIKYYGDDHVLGVVPDPVGYEFKFTIADATDATLDAVYEDAADTTRKFNVEVTKVNGDGTLTLTVKQTEGITRPASTGTLNLVSGTGDASIAFTDTEANEVFIALSNISGRLVALSNEGRLWISETNDGANFNGPQAERFEYGKEDGLSVTDAFSFARSVILNLSNQELQKASSASLTGNVRRDPSATVAQNPEDFFKVQRETRTVGLFGRSGQEIDNGFIGLSREGFVFVSTQDARREFGINNTQSLSTTIQNVVNRINYGLGDQVRSTVDDANQRYLCAVPASDDELNTLVFMYDFDNSTFAVANKAPVHKWSLFTYNLGGAGITSIFTIFGAPFLGLSDGRILQTDVVDLYTDAGETYRSLFTTKAFDFSVRHRYKTLDVMLIDLILDNNMKLDIFPVIDEFARKRDYDGTLNTIKNLTPISLATEDIWTNEESDIWTTNPLDIWGRTSAERYSYMGAKSVQKFQEMSLVVINEEGGKRWGAYGLELIASVEDEYYDGRIGQNTSVEDSAPAIDVNE